MKENAVRRANDPKRREKIIQATLEAVKTYGVHAVTHRKIAAIAQVPLGSMTYYFAGMDALLSEAFTLFTENMSRQYQDFFAQVTDAEGACQAITEMIYGSQVTTPDNMALMYQLYAYVFSLKGKLQFYPNPGQMMTISVPASVSRTLAMA